MEIWWAAVPEQHPASTHEPWLDRLPTVLCIRKRASRNAWASLSGYALLQRALHSHAIDTSLSPLRFTDWGKPYLPDGPFFSLSHSGRHVLCAVSNGPVGLDTEWAKPRPIQLPESLFSDAERRFVQEAADPLMAFYWLWTRKEAVSKADGQGISTFNKCNCAADTPIWMNGKTWYVQSVPVLDQHVTSIATHRPDPILTIRPVIL